MKLPTLEQLEHVTSLLWRQSFLELDDQRKLQIITIAQSGIMADVIDNLPLNIDIAIRELLAEKAKAIGSFVDFIDNIDTSLSHVGAWFEKSRLYEP